jgi:K+-sensing histidine kinase KdpD
MKVQIGTRPSGDVPVPHSRRIALRNVALGSAVCTGAAIMITIVSRNLRGTDALPLLFLVVVGLVAHRFGTSSAILGLVEGGFVFATFLFAPLGHLTVAQESARTNLIMMLLFGLAVAYFYGTGKSDDDTNNQKS